MRRKKLKKNFSLSNDEFNELEYKTYDKTFDKDFNYEIDYYVEDDFVALRNRNTCEIIVDDYIHMDELLRLMDVNNLIFIDEENITDIEGFATEQGDGVSCGTSYNHIRCCIDKVARYDSYRLLAHEEWPLGL